MATPFGVRSWLWVMARINCLYAQTFAKRSGRMWVTQWPYSWRNGSHKFRQELGRDLQCDDDTLRRILANRKYRPSTPVLVLGSRLRRDLPEARLWTAKMKR